MRPAFVTLARNCCRVGVCPFAFSYSMTVIRQGVPRRIGMRHQEGPTVSAIVAPRVPSGFGAPSVESRAV